MMKRTSAEKISQRFEGILRGWLTADEWGEMVAANRRLATLKRVAKCKCEDNPIICHSHDYCDANMAMHEAFAAEGIPLGDDGLDEKTAAIWNAAWEVFREATG
jgi:hypothetical protein